MRRLPGQPSSAACAWRAASMQHQRAGASGAVRPACAQGCASGQVPADVNRSSQEGLPPRQRCACLDQDADQLAHFIHGAAPRWLAALAARPRLRLHVRLWHVLDLQSRGGKRGWGEGGMAGWWAGAGRGGRPWASVGAQCVKAKQPGEESKLEPKNAPGGEYAPPWRGSSP